MNPVVTPPAAVAPAERKQIGVARMAADGTILLRMRMMPGPGDVEQRYVPGSADYARVRGHLAELKAGGEVPVYDDWQ